MWGIFKKNKLETMKQMEYNFKCDWDWTKPFNDIDNEYYRLMHLDCACNGNHIIKIDDGFYNMLIHKLEVAYGLSIDENFIENLLIDFESYFENLIKTFENGEWNINHFHSIDIYAEIISGYCKSKYGEIETNM